MREDFLKFYGLPLTGGANKLPMWLVSPELFASGFSSGPDLQTWQSGVFLDRFFPFISYFADKDNPGALPPAWQGQLRRRAETPARERAFGRMPEQGLTKTGGIVDEVIDLAVAAGRYAKALTWAKEGDPLVLDLDGAPSWQGKAARPAQPPAREPRQAKRRRWLADERSDVERRNERIPSPFATCFEGCRPANCNRDMRVESVTPTRSASRFVSRRACTRVPPLKGEAAHNAANDNGSSDNRLRRPAEAPLMMEAA